MSTNIYEQLTEAVRLVKERDKLLHRLEITRSMIREKQDITDRLMRQLASESKDVERLDGITLTNLWHSLRGTKEDAKRKETEEYLAAKLKFDEANAALTVLETDLARMESDLAAMGDPDPKYQLALREKEEYLLASGGADASRLFEIAEQMGYLKAEERELMEAIEAGKKVEKALAEVQKNLSSAEGWGTVDLLGGGFLSTAIKHSHISEARTEIEHAQQLLRNFQRELADIRLGTNTVEIGGLATFADFFLDGLLFDAIVQSKINTAQNRTKKLQQEVQATMHDLSIMQEQNSKKTLEMDQQRKQIIETAN